MAVLFDLDGTLTDPEEGIVSCIRFALSKLDIEIDESVQLTSWIGPPLQESFQSVCGDERLTEKAIALYRQRFSSVGLYENRLYAGVEGCLKALFDRDIPMYVVTSKPTVYAERIIKYFELESYFERVYGSHLDGKLSDKTSLLKHVLQSEGLDAVEVTMVGDRKFDIIGAKNNGIKSIGVLWGYGTEQELREAGADKIYQRPSQLIDLQ